MFERVAPLDGSERLVARGGTDLLCGLRGAGLRCAVRADSERWRRAESARADPDDPGRWRRERDEIARLLAGRSSAPDARSADLGGPDGDDGTFERSIAELLEAPALRELRTNASTGCAIAASGRVACRTLAGWGDGGGETISWPEVPGAVIPGLTDAVELAVGGRFNCARHATGRVSCWGENLGGTLSMGASSPWVVGLEEILARATVAPED
jgi:hypothetical protein